MKLKINIIGSKVHNVGYRPYLTESAMRLALRGFDVYNDGRYRLICPSDKRTPGNALIDAANCQTKIYKIFWE